MVTKKIIIDQGNTAIKVAIFHENTLLQATVVKTVTDIVSFLQENKHSVKYGLYSSVGNSVIQELREQLPTINWHNFTHQTPLPVTNCYKSPETLGLDRIAAAVGASCIFPNKNVLVVDAGTALTFEYITATNEYLGGAISPGLQMRYNALNSFTARLPRLSPVDTIVEIGTDTETSIIAGVQNGICNEIDQTIEQYKTTHSVSEVILTGGDCAFFDKRLKSAIFAAPELVLIGLNEILNYTIEKACD